MTLKVIEIYSTYGKERLLCIRGKISKTMKMKTRKPVLYTYNKKKYICKTGFLIYKYTYIYIYIYRERERERERPTERETETKRHRERATNRGRVHISQNSDILFSYLFLL